jgi:methylmalonyl-CoA/ethylmalonyl-CoA epimerase
MLKRLNHVAIAVKDLTAASAIYRDRLGAKVSDVAVLPEHGVAVVFVELSNTRLELIAPLDDESPIAKFVAKHPDGAIHHLCFEVDDISAACDRVRLAQGRVLGTGCPTLGAHGKPVIFLDPKDFGGALIELEESCSRA